MSDPEDLVARCRAGDPGAFGELFRRHRTDVTRLLARMAGQHADLEDLVQEVFLQIHKSIPSFRSESRLSTWIYRVTVNVALMARRAQKSRPLSHTSSVEPLLYDESAPPDEQVSRRRRIEALHRLLDQLSDKKRAVYVLHEIEGLSPAEIAEVVGAPVLTVRTRLFYARREVLARLGDEPSLRALFEEAGERPTHPPVREPHKEPA